MSGLGSGSRGEFTFLDSVALLSFFLGVMNLEENLTQSDKQDLQDDLNGKIDVVLTEIHGHLEEQDKKLDTLLDRIARTNDETD